MSQRIFITATNTDIGKTYAALRLIEQFASLGYSVAALKPIETGVVDRPNDATALLQKVQRHNPKAASLHVNDIVPYRFSLPAAPFIANGANPVDLTRIDKALQKLERIADIVVIEGAGGLFVPIDDSTAMIDLIKRYDAKTLLITHCSLGCINDTILSRNALRQERIASITALNCKEDFASFQEISKPYFDAKMQDIFYLHDDIRQIAKALISYNGI